MNNSEIFIYQNPDGNIKIDVLIDEETVWLKQEQMATLFGKSSTIAANCLNKEYAEKQMKNKLKKKLAEIA